MTAVWVVRDKDGELDAAFTKEFRAVAYMGQHYVGGVTVTRETLLTPAHAAVIEAAKAWTTDQRGWLKPLDEALAQAVDTLRELEGET